METVGENWAYYPTKIIWPIRVCQNTHTAEEALLDWEISYA